MTVTYFSCHIFFRSILDYNDTFHRRMFHGRTLDCNPLQQSSCIHKRIAVAEGEHLILKDQVLWCSLELSFVFLLSDVFAGYIS